MEIALGNDQRRWGCWCQGVGEHVVSAAAPGCVARVEKWGSVYVVKPGSRGPKDRLLGNLSGQQPELQSLCGAQGGPQGSRCSFALEVSCLCKDLLPPEADL